MKKIFISFFIACLSFYTSVDAQSPDSLKLNKQRRNVIKFNVSSYFVYKVAALVEYERVVNKSQSFSIQAGFVSMALFSFLDSDSIRVLDFKRNGGYSVTGDYRFYLQKENKDGAPHGVYIGPYLGFLHFTNEASLQLVSGPNSLLTNLDIFSVGAELGYQFLLGKRWTLDFILVGPSMTNYKVQMDLALPVDTSHLNEVQQKVLVALGSKFPIVSTLINNESATFKGNLNNWNVGFRYSMHVGFRF